MPVATKGSSPQFQVCAALLAHGPMKKDALRSKVKINDDKSFSNACSQARIGDRIEKGNDGTYRITAKGKEWVSGGANLMNQKRSAPAKVALAARTRQVKESSSSEQQRPGAPKTFRCAVFSDGGFFLAKGDQRIELEPAEHMQMLDYLERMAVQEAA